jgi:hypothetical protein
MLVHFFLFIVIQVILIFVNFRAFDFLLLILVMMIDVILFFLVWMNIGLLLMLWNLHILLLVLKHIESFFLFRILRHLLIWFLMHIRKRKTCIPFNFFLPDETWRKYKSRLIIRFLISSKVLVYWRLLFPLQMLNGIFWYLKRYQLMSIGQVDKASFTYVKIAGKISEDIWPELIGFSPTEIADQRFRGALHLFEGVLVKASLFGTGRFAAGCTKYYPFLLCAALRAESTTNSFLRAGWTGFVRYFFKEIGSIYAWHVLLIDVKKVVAFVASVLEEVELLFLPSLR